MQKKKEKKEEEEKFDSGNFQSVLEREREREEEKEKKREREQCSKNMYVCRPLLVNCNSNMSGRKLSKVLGAKTEKANSNSLLGQ